eukprot:CAMPEP_0117657514 /NCGR_PEP_ID=MMETSP0804-20121206/5371_1 /TAXON_ID=1074897 /ORGANISM="Tetraselmis astigmatica, Strain CCMP880" /LENGTH=218 /DNA_ID=CAMNT_0005463973 /DNA_START=723 /DNA_END=1380 /DNA_ORIENTATION=-
MGVDLWPALLPQHVVPHGHHSTAAQIAWLQVWEEVHKVLWQLPFRQHLLQWVLPWQNCGVVEGYREPQVVAITVPFYAVFCPHATSVGVGFPAPQDRSGVLLYLRAWGDEDGLLALTPLLGAGPLPPFPAAGARALSSRRRASLGASSASSAGMERRLLVRPNRPPLLLVLPSPPASSFPPTATASAALVPCSPPSAAATSPAAIMSSHLKPTGSLPA